MKWISVKDRLPSSSIDVLTLKYNKEKEEFFYLIDSFHTDKWTLEGETIFWQDLPYISDEQLYQKRG